MVCMEGSLLDVSGNEIKFSSERLVCVLSVCIHGCQERHHGNMHHCFLSITNFNLN